MKLTGTAYHKQMTPLAKVFYLGLMLGLLFISFAPTAQSQVTSEKGWVTATANTGCAGLTITLTHQRIDGGELFYSFEGNAANPAASIFDGTFTEGENSIVHTYSTSGTFTIIIIDQTGGSNEEDRTDRLEITVLPDTPPETSVASCLGRSIQITFDKDNDPFDSYVVDFGDGSPTQTVSGDDVLDYTYGTVGEFDIEIEGQLSGGDASSCSLAEHRVTVLDNLPTPILNSIAINDPETITFSYETLSENLSYVLEIDRGTGFEDWVKIDPQANTNNFQYTSSNLNLNEEGYRFRIRAEDACGLFQAFSEIGNSIAFQITFEAITTNIDFNLDWVTDIKGFTQIDFFSDDQLLTTFNQNEASDFLFSTMDCTDLGDFSLQGSFNGVLSTSMIIDPFISTTLTLPPPPTPGAELTGVNANLTFPQTDFSSSNFQVFRKDIDDQFSLVTDASGPTFVDVSIPLGLGEVCYRITYEDACGNTSAPSEEVCLALGSSLGIPNAFSPNNDGINDVFKVKDANYLSFTLEIFNRWGNLVFRATDPSIGWDGDFEGRPAPAGSYTYRVSFQGTDKVPFTRAGSFLLIR